MFGPPTPKPASPVSAPLAPSTAGVLESDWFPYLVGCGAGLVVLLAVCGAVLCCLLRRRKRYDHSHVLYTDGVTNISLDEFSPANARKSHMYANPHAGPAVPECERAMCAQRIHFNPNYFRPPAQTTPSHRCRKIKQKTFCTIHTCQLTM